LELSVTATWHEVLISSVSLALCDVCTFFKVYNQCGYIEIVRGLAEESMQAAVEEVQTLAHYSSDGEVILLTK